MKHQFLKRVTAISFAAFATAIAGAAPPVPQFNLVKPSTTGIPGEECRVMAFDPQGNLWVAGRSPFWSECGLAMLPADQLAHQPLPGGGFDTGAWRVWSNVHYPQGFPSAFINDIEFSNQGDGIIWIGSGLTTNSPDDGGLVRFDPNAPDGSPQQWTLYDAANSPMTVNGVRSIDQDSMGNLWFTNVANAAGSGPDALMRFNPITNQWVEYNVGQEIPGWDPPWTEVSGVMVGADDHVYVTNATLSGFAEFDPDSSGWTFHGGVGPGGGMLEDTEGNIWFATGGNGLFKWDGSNVQHWPILGGTFTITGLGLGLDGTVYVSCWYGPILKMINDLPEYFVDADNIPRGVHQRPNGEIWINNYGGNGTPGTVRHYTADGQLLERINTFNSGLPDYFIDNIQTDSDGHLWFAGGEGGLSRMQVSNGAHGFSTHWRNWGNHNDLSEPYPWAGNDPMYSMFDASDGTIWMGGNGIGQWDPKSCTFLNFWNWQNSSLGVDSFISIIQDGNGDIWAFSDYTGGYHLNPATNDWDQHLFGAAFSTANYVNDATLDIDGNLWVSTDVALHFYNGMTWFAVGVPHGSPVEWPTAVEADPSGGIWIGASNGLIHYEDGTWSIYDTSNAPLPTNYVHGLDVREDGLIGFTVADFNQPTPWPNGVVLFDGEDSWDVYTYGTHPLPHYQLGDVEFDADGDLWVSAISEGVVEIVLEPRSAIPGDITDVKPTLGTRK